MKTATGKSRAGLLACACVLGLCVASTAQAGNNHRGGHNGHSRYSVSVGFNGGYYAPGYYAPRYYAPARYGPSVRYYQRGAGVYGRICRRDEITTYHGDGSISCAYGGDYYYGDDDRYYGNGAYYGAYPSVGITYYGGGYYRGGYRGHYRGGYRGHGGHGGGGHYGGHRGGNGGGHGGNGGGHRGGGGHRN